MSKEKEALILAAKKMAAIITAAKKIKAAKPTEEETESEAEKD